MQENEKYNNEDIDNFLMPYLYNNYNLRQMDQSNSAYARPGPSNFEHPKNLLVLQDLKFENLINNRFFHANEMIEAYQGLKEALITMEGIIESENQLR